MPTIITRGAGSAQGLGYASSSAEATFIEDVFSTYLYTGNGATQTITNGIDLSGEGGLVWIKSRTNSGGTGRHSLWDTVRGRDKTLVINTSAQDTGIGAGQGVTSFNSNGFSLGTPYYETNVNGDSVASWTFREQPKFFDIVTYTTVAGAMTIPHNLGAVPGCWIIKATNAVDSWWVFHRSIPGQLLRLNGTSTVESGFSTATSTNITISNGVFSPDTQIVIYLFAHDAGGFGLTGTDNVISCGSLTMGSGITTATLGYEPQWLLIKGSNNANEWWLIDNMRGFSQANYARLFANSSAAESVSSGPYILPTATGFTMDGSIFGSGNSFIYIAIRRGPMKVPTSGTSVFSPIYSAASANTVLTTSFPVDLQIPAYTGATIGRFVVDRLRGVVTTAVDAATSPWMKTNSTDAETTGFNITRAWNNTGYQIPQYLGGATTVYFNFRRAPGFFDEVCYTGAGGTRTINHNLNVAPEMMILRARSGAANWEVYHKDLNALGTQTADDSRINLNTVNAATASNTIWNSTPPTASVFSIGNNNDSNQSGITFVNYLFATCSGVSKVGSYTGTGTTQTINCGFTAGARFVLIKRADSTGDWYVWDSARGIVAGNDPYLLLNSTAAEVTGTDYVDTASSGFEISSTAPAAINANGGSFIFLAIA